MQYIREGRDGSRQKVTEWEWLADKNQRGYRSIHHIVNLLIYKTC